MKLNAGRGFRPITPDPRCSENCLKYASKPVWGKSRYEVGQKYCDVCRIFMNFEDDICPCCKNELRNKSKLQIKNNGKNPN